jgi:hypothetical protein
MNPHKATGPKSDAGKQIASKNAIKDGLTARRFLSEEEIQEFKDTMVDLIEEHQPQTKTEFIQIERIATTITRLRRIVSIEDAKFQLAKIDRPKFIIPQRALMNGITGLPKEDNETIAAAATLEIEASMPNHQTLEMIHRMQISMSRQLSRELGELIAMIDRREKRMMVIESDHEHPAMNGEKSTASEESKKISL